MGVDRAGIERDVSRELEFPALSYPGPLIAASGLLRAGFFHALAGDRQSPVADLQLPGLAGATMRTLLQHGGCASIERRTVVLATGSNASPGVMHRKLSRAGVSATLPFVQCEVRGLAVGHSAHISARGYIAAAPYADPTARTATVASWLDDEQLSALDLTEPNYRRVRLPDKLFRSR